MLYRNTELNIISIIAQTLFSSELLSKYIRLEFLRSENEKIFEELYNMFLISKKSNVALKAKIIDALTRYESAKAYSGIKQSSNIFHEINGNASKEWEEIKNKLDIQ